MTKDTKNFKVSEFACKHCGENKIDQRVLDMAQTLRDELGVPVRVNSGYRCEKHNARVGGVKGSFHTKGLAYGETFNGKKKQMSAKEPNIRIENVS